MRAKIAQILTVMVLVCAIGGYWAILQSVAWVGMAVNYSQNSTLKEALVKTFDGKHPCKLCKVVQEGKRSEKKQEAQKLDSKLDFFLVKKQMFVCPSLDFSLTPIPSHCARSRPEIPPYPPPRKLLG